jgi:hypothetical protein
LRHERAGRARESDGSGRAVFLVVGREAHSRQKTGLERTARREYQKPPLAARVRSGSPKNALKAAYIKAKKRK